MGECDCPKYSEEIDKVGMTFRIWNKWSKLPRKRLGTLRVTDRGIHWRPLNHKYFEFTTWDDFAGEYE